MANIQVFADQTAIQEAAAQRIAASAARAISERGRFSIALSGGSTPRGLYERLTQQPFRSQIDWEKVHVFWGDERYVPREDPESNYHLAYEALLSQVPIPVGQIHSFPTNLADPQQAANAYTKELQAFVAEATPGAVDLTSPTAGEMETTPPLSQIQLDLILLGMGPDGHTASLFPHSATLDADDDVLVAVEEQAPKPPPVRLTLTLPVINSAREVIFLVAGSDKAATLRAVVNGTGDFPSQRVQPTSGELIWLVDAAAGTGL